MESPEEIIIKDRYIAQRWQVQRDYYQQRARNARRQHESIEVVKGLGIVSLPLLMSVPNIPSTIPMLLSIGLALGIALQQFFLFEDQRTFSTSVAAGLEQEKALFESRVGPYENREDAFRLFVERCETILSQESRTLLQKSA